MLVTVKPAVCIDIISLCFVIIIVEEMAVKLADTKNQLLPLSAVWTVHFLDGSKKADELIEVAAFFIAS